jgi:hAT family C-terminal dimerisation region
VKEMFGEMVPEVRNEFYEIEKLVRILMVYLASSAAAERSFSAFSALLRITWVRSTMGQERLNSVAILHIQQNVLDGIDMNMVAELFVSASDVRGSMFRKGSWKM